MSEFSFAIVGCGSIGSRHIRNLIQCGERNITAVDVSRDRREEASAAYGVGAAATLDDALKDGANVVFVTLPNAFHYDVLKQAIASGCHVFCEKPLASASDGVDELVAQAREKRLVGFMGSNFKFHPSFSKMKQLIEDGTIGRVLSARALCGQYLPDWHPWEDYRQGYSARSDLGGGVLLDSHEFTYMTWLLGPVSSVACMSDRISDLEIDTEDTASILLKMSSGAQAEIHLDYTQRAYQRSYDLCGSIGSLHWNIRDRCVKVYSADSGVWTVHEEPAYYDLNQMYVEQTRHFLSCLRGEAEPATTLEEGLRTLRLIEAARQSSRERRFVEVDQ